MSKSAKKPQYQRVNHVEHVLLRPDGYIGSTTMKTVEDYIAVDDEFHIQRKTIEVSAGILRIFYEIISNAMDNVARSRQNKVKVARIAVSVNEETGETIVQNDGEVIPIELHEKENCYNHTLIFGHLLSGSNYDDTEERVDIGGRFGVGAKATNIFSTKFTVEGTDPERGKKFSQTWTKNMTVADEPIITSYKGSDGYTKITYFPDFKQFGLEKYTRDIVNMYKKYVVDCAMVTKVNVTFNGILIPVNTLLDYSNLYYDKQETKVENEEKEDEKDEKEETKSSKSEDEKRNGHLYIKTKDCEVVLRCCESDKNTAISFVNGIYTPKNGTHVDPWVEAFFRPLLEKLNKPKRPQLDIGDVKKFFCIFVNASVSKPTFDNLTKQELTAPKLTAEVKKTQITAITKWAVYQDIQDMIQAKELFALKKIERKKRGYVKIAKLERALKEGTKDGYKCMLILTEGDSAASMAIRGLEKGLFGYTGREYIGIMPLRGKILNTRNATSKQITDNEAVCNIVRAIGLESGIDYTDEENYKKLRYGRVVIMTDADVDGIHICSLIQNIFHSLFPSLLHRKEAFIVSMQTQIVKVFLPHNKSINFFSEADYRNYVREHENEKINKKYYKGLGTSTYEDIEDVFGKKIIAFNMDENTDTVMTRTFHKNYSDSRKRLLEHYDENRTVLKWNGEEEEILDVKISEFLDTEQIKFSHADCKRSIPSVIDGLKESQRKILFAFFKTKLDFDKPDRKVAQIGSRAAELSCYHHGETNMFDTIIKMAQSFQGSNNIPLLLDVGEFGSRRLGGEDAAAPRYIYTKLGKLTRLIFRSEDDAILDYLEYDGDSIEPRFYVPIIPMVLVNGVVGIGTGWSTNIPCYNPKDIIKCIHVWLNNDGDISQESEGMKLSLLPELSPWYRGHTGKIENLGKGRFMSYGNIEPLAGKKEGVRITELPIGVWTGKYTEEILEEMASNGDIQKYEIHSKSPNVIDIAVYEHASKGIACTITNLKLKKPISINNMVLFNEHNCIKKFNDIDQIIDDFCKIRLPYYTKRKELLIREYTHKINVAKNKKRFIECVRDNEIELVKTVKGKRTMQKTSDLISLLKKMNFYENVSEEVKEEKEESEEGEEERNEEKEEKEDKKAFDYLLKMQFNTLTFEKAQNLEKLIQKLEEELEIIQNTNEKQMWKNDLKEFEDAYDEWLVFMEKRETPKKQKGLKTKKNKV